MKLKLKWINRNTDEDGTRVFRSDTPITTVEGLSAIATLPQGSSEYEDNVIQGKTYYYLLQSFKDGDDYTSQPITVFASPYSGAGSQELKMGDYGRGYFGLVDGSSFITTAEILNRLKFTGAETSPVVSTGTSSPSMARSIFSRKRKQVSRPGIFSTAKALFSVSMDPDPSSKVSSQLTKIVRLP